MSKTSSSKIFLQNCSQLIEAALKSLKKSIKNQLNRIVMTVATVHCGIIKEKKVIWNQNVFTE